jgi:hypothetical protein
MSSAELLVETGLHASNLILQGELPRRRHGLVTQGWIGAGTFENATDHF